MPFGSENPSKNPSKNHWKNQWFFNWFWGAFWRYFGCPNAFKITSKIWSIFLLILGRFWLPKYIQNELQNGSQCLDAGHFYTFQKDYKIKLCFFDVLGRFWKPFGLPLDAILIYFGSLLSSLWQLLGPYCRILHAPRMDPKIFSFWPQLGHLFQSWDRPCSPIPSRPLKKEVDASGE